jgi:hypothetical protein
MNICRILDILFLRIKLVNPIMCRLLTKNVKIILWNGAIYGRGGQAGQTVYQANTPAPVILPETKSRSIKNNNGGDLFIPVRKRGVRS